MKEGSQESKLYRFPKEERLHHRSLVEGLFRLGKTFYEYPFKVAWRPLSGNDLEKNFRKNVPEGIGKLQVLITVPKKKRRRAVDRVLMRRRIRESYRLNRLDLREILEKRPGHGTMSVALIYLQDKNLPYNVVEEKIKAVLRKLESKISNLE